MDNETKQTEQNKDESSDHSSSYIRIKKFQFVMLLFFTVILAAGITMIALSFGKEQAVSVSSERSEFTKLYEAYDTLNQYYYKDLESKDLVNGAIDGMFAALDDPYSDYMNEDEAKSFNENISSSFEGIGAEIQKEDDAIVIVTPLKGSPAEKAGLKPNDKVLSVDGKSVQGLSSSQAVMLIRGEKGTKVELEIERAGSSEPMKISITRDTIPIETVYGELKDGIAKIQITSFSEHTSKELIELLNEYKQKDMKGIVLDLRQNPGGILQEVQTIANLFVPEGKTIYKIEHKNGKIDTVNSDGKDSIDTPLVVLIDGGSASASEIFAAAVNQSADVPLVGLKSFGKGTVQQPENFSDGSIIKLTTDKWLTPNGSWIHEKGIEPTYKVELPSYASLSIINPDSVLKKESNSDEVKTAQEMLKALGYKPGKVNGYFSEATEEATKQFQEKEKLKVDGKITGDTTLKLMEKLREKIANTDTQMNKAMQLIKEEINKK